MGIKSKVLGTIAAAALTLSMVAGVAGQTDTGNASGSVVLDGDCSINVTKAAADFGTWRWNGSAYEISAGTASDTILFGLKTHQSGGKCTVNVNSTNYSKTGGPGTFAISKFNYTVSFNGNQAIASAPGATNVAISGAPQGNYSINSTLTNPGGVVNGTYTGTMVITVLEEN